MIKRKDLTDISDDNYPQRYNEVMQCQNCGKITSGIRGNYWREDMDYAFHCIECESQDIALVVPYTQYHIVKK